MIKTRVRRFSNILAFFALLQVLCVSCTTSKQMVVLNNLNSDSIRNYGLDTAQAQFDYRIQKNDLLWISIGGPNAQDLVGLNSAIGVPGQAPVGAIYSQNTNLLGYLVDSDGNIKLPYIGKYKAEGFTRKQLEDSLKVQFDKYTRESVVNVRFMNYKITVIGEVARPGTFTVPNDRVTILEALGLAGDLTVMGKRNTVLVLREVNGKREVGRVDLLSKDIFKSPYYYLSTNDVVYVEPAPAKFFARERLPQFITLAASGLSLLLTAITISKL